MKRIAEDLGGHAGLGTTAMTKQEVSAALCRVGFICGLWSVPEFAVAGRNGSRSIDVVWARRVKGVPGTVWKPVAAFEIDGHGVDLKNIKKNADSLDAAGRAGAVIRALILFQVGPTGERWTPVGSQLRANRLICEELVALESPRSVEVVMDASLQERLQAWSRVVAS